MGLEQPQVSPNQENVHAIPWVTHVLTVAPNSGVELLNDMYTTAGELVPKAKHFKLEILIGTERNIDTSPSRVIKLKEGNTDRYVDVSARLEIKKRHGQIVVVDSQEGKHWISTVVEKSHKLGLTVYLIKAKREKILIEHRNRVKNPKPKQLSKSNEHKKPLVFGPGRRRFGVPKQIPRPKEQKLTWIEKKHVAIRSYTLDGKPVADMKYPDRKRAYKKLGLTKDEARVFELLMVEGLKNIVHGKEVAKKMHISQGWLGAHKERLIRKFKARGAQPIEKEKKPTFRTR